MKAIMGLMIGAIALSGCSPGESRVDYRTGGGNSAQGHRFYSFVDMSEYPDLEDDMTILSERLVDILNTTLHLPERDIGIHFESCGTINAYYSPSESKIVMCPELLIDLIRFHSTHPGLEEWGSPFYTYLTVFGHELGHALIDQFALPVLGKNEDAADVIMATGTLDLFLTDPDTEAGKQTLSEDHGKAMIVLGEYFANTTMNYASKHSIGPVRQANFVCWSLGRHPHFIDEESFAGLSDVLNLKGRDCQREYKRMKNDAHHLLADFLIEQPE